MGSLLYLLGKVDNDQTILAYVQIKSTVKLYNDYHRKYHAQWLSPATNQYQKGNLQEIVAGILEITSP
jgi:hypothetical protein